MLAKHGSRPSPITPWNSNGESPWNIQDESPLFVIHDSRLVHQNSCSSVRCSCSRCSSASPSTGLCSVCQEQIAFLTHTISIYINHLHNCVSGVSGVSGVSAFLSCIYSFSKQAFFFINWTSTWNYLTHLTHISTTRATPHFLIKSSWHTCWHAPDTQRPVPDTHHQIRTANHGSLTINRTDG